MIVNQHSIASTISHSMGMIWHIQRKAPKRHVRKNVAQEMNALDLIGMKAQLIAGYQKHRGQLHLLLITIIATPVS